MSRSFVDRDTERIWRREPTKRLDLRIHKAANRTLHLLDAVTTLDALRVPQGNRLEALKGERVGQHSTGSTTSGGSVSAGRKPVRRMCRSWTSTRRRDA